MALISTNEYLTVAEMTDNAQYVFDYFFDQGWTAEAICGMLGNMQWESHINPGVWQNLDYGNYNVGYGLVQWTPASKVTSWLISNGYDIGDIGGQCARIMYELNNYGTQWRVDPISGYTFAQYTKLTADPSTMAYYFLKDYEQAGDEHLSERQSYATYWYTNLAYGGTALVYTPRLSSDGMQGSKYYYSDNPFYQAGYGLPNCTCYAWGRQYEITDVAPTLLSLGDANQWWKHANEVGASTGQTPKLGAVVCYYYDNGGHVAIVEKINSDGSIVISESAYGGSYFFTETVTAANNYSPSWLANYGGYFQGFIYLENGVVFPDSGGSAGGGGTSGGGTSKKRHKMPVWMMIRRF
jgi:surface antigen